MKYIITEQQYNLLLEEDKEQKVLELPGLDYFGSWDILQKFLERRGNPLFSIDGDLNLFGTKIKSIDNLVSVGGDLSLRMTPIKDLGNLEYVGGDLDLAWTPIEYLGNLKEVGGDLSLRMTPIKDLGKDEIREMIDVGGAIFM
jgi:hypothetical protein